MQLRSNGRGHRSARSIDNRRRQPCRIVEAGRVPSLLQPPRVVVLPTIGRAEDDRPLRHLPAGIAADHFLRAVRIAQPQLCNHLRRTEAAPELRIPSLRIASLRSLHVVHAIAQHHSQRIGSHPQRRLDVVAVERHRLPIIRPRLVQRRMRIARRHSIHARFVLPQPGDAQHRRHRHAPQRKGATENRHRPAPIQLRTVPLRAPRRCNPFPRPRCRLRLSTLLSRQLPSGNKNQPRQHHQHRNPKHFPH